MARREQSPDRVSQVSSCPPGPPSHRESTLDAAESRPAVSVGDRDDLLEGKTSVSSFSAAGSLNSQPYTERTVENAPSQPVRPTDEEILAQENKIRCALRRDCAAMHLLSATLLGGTCRLCVQKSFRWFNNANLLNLPLLFCRFPRSHPTLLFGLCCREAVAETSPLVGDKEPLSALRKGQ